MRQRIQRTILPRLGRPVVIGEYPYYRAHPSRWRDNLRALRDLGVDAISCYVPWRFHEVQRSVYDFSGSTDRQRDVRGLLAAIGELGLVAVVKPGPFIHAEVQLGGLPDRLCDRSRPIWVGTDGLPLTSQGVPLPSLFDPVTWEEVESWMRAVAEQLIAPLSAPAGPIAAAQLGNEGLYSDAHLPIGRSDASAPARQAFAAWLRAGGDDALVTEVDRDASFWWPGLRQRWSRWCGHAIADRWQRLAALLPAGTPTVVNVPLAPLASAGAALDAWASRFPALARSGHLLGHTEWVGNAAASPDAFVAHLFGIRLGGTEVVEANWGFTWTDGSFAEARTPLFHALLALMLGSSTCSVYTACATSSWGTRIDMDPAGLRAEGIDPALHAPPYCPGAPTTEGGVPGRTAEGLRLLAEFLRRFGASLLESELLVDAVLEVDGTLPEAQAWSAGGATLLAQAAARVGELLLRHQILLDPRWRGREEAEERSARAPALPRASLRDLAETAGDVPLAPPRSAAPWSNAAGRVAILRRRSRDARTEIVGVFNPGSEPDRALRSTPAGNWELSVPGGTAAVLVIRDGALVGWVATPAERPSAAVALTTPAGVGAGR